MGSKNVTDFFSKPRLIADLCSEPAVGRTVDEWRITNLNLVAVVMKLIIFVYTENIVVRLSIVRELRKRSSSGRVLG